MVRSHNTTTPMTKRNAIIRLRRACELIFSVEQEMDIRTSEMRKTCYTARCKIGAVNYAIYTTPKNEKLSDL